MFYAGCGSLAASVQTAVNREPDYICGKPYEPMYRVLNLKNNIVNERTLMIGDRWEYWLNMYMLEFWLIECRLEYWLIE